MTNDQPKRDPSAIVVPFGKHKGKTVAELLTTDPTYADWVTAQGWVAERFAELHAAILSRGAGTDDTPEHNALQGRFLDSAFCLATLRVLRPARIANEIKSLRNVLASRRKDPAIRQRQNVEYAEAGVRQAMKGPWFVHDWTPEKIQEVTERNIAEAEQTLAEEKEKFNKIQDEIDNLPDLSSYKARVLCQVEEFEYKGVDVVLKWTVEFDIYTETGTLNVELKPSLGDDYPSVMRQMRTLGCRHIVVGTYTGRGLSEPQLRSMFETNGMRLVFLQEIEEALRAASP